MLREEVEELRGLPYIGLDGPELPELHRHRMEHPCLLEGHRVEHAAIGIERNQQIVLLWKRLEYREEIFLSHGVGPAFRARGLF